MSKKTGRTTVDIKYQDVEKTFSGSLEEVWSSVNKFFGEFIPSFEVARRLMLSVDLEKLVADCEGIIGFGMEGAQLLVSKDMLTDNETLMLWLLAAHVGFQLGLIESVAVTREQLQTRLGKSGKITSTRLGELVKNDMIVKTAENEYRISTFGIMQTQKETLPKIKAKMP